MAFYLAKERAADIVGSYRRYQNYLRECQQKFPAGAFALGTAEWWQNPQDHRSPHDGWLENFSVAEVRETDAKRITTIRVRLLSAHHNGFIELLYPRVFSYKLQSPSCVRGLGDWRYDEFTLSPEGHVIHEIEWAGFPCGEGARWIIEASDIEFQWMPK